MARAVLELEGFLSSRGARLVLVQYDRSPPMPILFERILGLGLRAPIVPFLVKPLKSDTLGNDPHPNARTLEGLALHVARFLLEQGFVARGADRPLAEPPRELVERLAPVPTLESCAELAAESRAKSLAALSPRIEWASRRGVRQILGNLSPFGMVGTRLVAVLRGGHWAVRITLEAIPERPDLYPLQVGVEISGRSYEPLRIEPGARAEGLHVLPAPGSRLPAPGSRLPAPGSEALGVRLVPERWGVIQHKQRSGVAAFQFVALETVDE